MSASQLDELCFAPLTELTRLLNAGELSSEELVAWMLRRIERFDQKLHAYVDVYRAKALTAARGADALRRSGVKAPLLGIPIAVKDLFEIEGHPITAGSRAFYRGASAITATVVTKLWQAGAIVLGKTHTVEFAFGGWGTNAVMGTPWNPWDLATHRVPGGSSSGSAVAVAAGLASAAIGTDTGGSVRIPAGLCGVVGLKTTPGLLSRHGLLKLCPTHDTVGPITHTADDAELMFNVMRGYDPLDETSVADAGGDEWREQRGNLSRLRVWVLPDSERDQVNSAVLRVYDEALAVLSRQGVVLVDQPLPRQLREYMQVAGNLMSAEGYANLGALFEREDLTFDPHVRRRILSGRSVGAADYLQLQEQRRVAQKEMRAAMEGVDVCVFPTNAISAIAVSDVDETATPLSLLGRFVNLLGLCSLAVPIGFTEQGMPVSMQIVGRPFAEPLVLHIGSRYQKVTDWHTRRPAGLHIEGSEQSLTET